MGDSEEVDGADVMESALLLDEGPEIASLDSEERPLAYKIVHPRPDRPRRLVLPPTWFPLHALSGLLGLISLALPWAFRAHYREYEAFSVFRYIVDVGEYNTLYSVIIMLILAGSILCFVTSSGCILQMAGVFLFATEVPEIQGFIGPGPFFAVAAALTGMASVALHARARIPARLATFAYSEQGGLSVNLLAISAFAIGLLSLFTSWVSVEQSVHLGPVLPDTQYSMLSFLFDVRFNEVTLMIAGAAIVSFGAVLCVMTPLGSLLLMLGTGLFFFELRSSFHDYATFWWSGEVSMGAGFFLAIAACIIGVWSMVFVRRIGIPNRFVPSPPIAPTPQVDECSKEERTQGLGERRSWFSRVFDRVPRIARIPTAAAITMALILAIMLVPFALPLSVIEVRVSNASVDSVEVDVYIDGEIVSSGVASPYSPFMCESRVKAGIHTVGLDYAYSSDEYQHPDGKVDWTSSVEVKTYREFLLPLTLMGYYDERLPIVEMSCSSSAEGYVLTLDEVRVYTPYGERNADVSWSDLLLIVVEGSDSGIGWSFNSADLDDGVFSHMDYGTQSFGNLSLNCTVFDLVGDGEAGAGDYVELAVVAGEFSESLEYVAYLMDDPYDAVIVQVTLAG